MGGSNHKPFIDVFYIIYFDVCVPEYERRSKWVSRTTAKTKNNVFVYDTFRFVLTYPFPLDHLFNCHANDVLLIATFSRFFFSLTSNV